MMRITLVAVVMLAGCGTDDVPSCQQAVTHYYDSGCRLFDSSGQPYSLTQSISDCKDVNAAVPDRCQSHFDDLMSCFDSTPNPSKTNADCDCSQEQDALFGCQ